MTATAENIAAVRTRIEAACERAERDPASVRLIGACKSVASSLIEDALAAGLTDLGENFVREAEQRMDALGSRAGDATWHFIGHLQTNKVREAIERFDILQSIDSIRLAQTVSRRVTKPIRILLEVNVAGETSKFGFAPSDLADAIAAVRLLPHLDLQGLMTIAPAAADPEQVRPCFGALRDLGQRHGLAELSMGMTDDFEIAIEEGATMVRIGRAIFGERPR